MTGSPIPQKTLYEVLTDLASSRDRDNPLTMTNAMSNEDVMRLSGGDRHKVSNYLSNLARREIISKEPVDSLGIRAYANGERFGYYKKVKPTSVIVDKPTMSIVEEDGSIIIDLKDFKITIAKK